MDGLLQGKSWDRKVAPIGGGNHKCATGETRHYGATWLQPYGKMIFQVGSGEQRTSWIGPTRR